METASKPLPDRNQSRTSEQWSQETGLLRWPPSLVQERVSELHLPGILRGIGDLTRVFKKLMFHWHGFSLPGTWQTEWRRKNWQPVRSFRNGQTRQGTPGLRSQQVTQSWREPRGTSQQCLSLAAPLCTVRVGSMEDSP